jgi:hypothetical protein
MGRSGPERRACPFCKKKIAVHVDECPRCGRVLIERVAASGPAPATDTEEADSPATEAADRARATARDGRPSPRRQPGSLAISCPHCGENPVELALKVWLMRGFILAVRYGSRIEVGCRGCVRRRLRANAGANLALGWWCFPWGIATPLVVLQNLVSLLRRPPGVLDEALLNAGIEREEVLVDQFGLTGDERRVLWAVLTYATRLSAAVSDPTLLRAGAEIASQLSDGAVSVDEAFTSIDDARRTPVAVQSFDPETRLLLLRVVADLATRSGRPSPSMVDASQRIADELGFDAHTIRTLLGLEDDASRPRREESTSEIELACTVLGVARTATVLEIRSRYRSLMLEFHPDHASEHGLDEAAATEMAQRLNWAYAVLMESQRTNA